MSTLPAGNIVPAGEIVLVFGAVSGMPMNDRVVVDAAGNVFGTAFNGGNFGICPAGCGVVFQVAP